MFVTEKSFSCNVTISQESFEHNSYFSLIQLRNCRASLMIYIWFIYGKYTFCESDINDWNPLYDFFCKTNASFKNKSSTVSYTQALTMPGQQEWYL